MPTKQSTQAGYGSRATSTSGSQTTNNSCPECEQAGLTVDGNERFCPACGVVVSADRIERSIPRWVDRHDRHIGPGESNQWLQRGTCIGFSSEDGGARTARLRRYNTRLDSSEQSLYRGLRELRGICEELEVGKEFRERAAYIYGISVKEGLLQGRSLESLAGAAVFVALRERTYPITLEWLADAAFATRDELSRAYRVLLSELDLQVLPPSPREFLPRLASILNVSPRLERTAGRILRQAENAGASQGKHPAGFAGTALYAAAQVEGRTLKQEAVANAAGVSIVTISRRWQSLDEELDLREVE